MKESQKWLHELFDLLAFVSAFFSTVSLVPLLAFDAFDYADADSRAFARTPSRGEHQISWAISFWAPLSCVLSCLSLVAAILGRMLSIAEDRQNGTLRARLHKINLFLLVFALVTVMLSIILFPIALYYSGFVMFVDEVVWDSNQWFTLGASFMAISATLIVISFGTLALVYCCQHKPQEGAAHLTQSEISV
jgi:hypothetical protein